ncbi:MAG TPA: hypothetical protein VHC19_15365, partial [Pirellulales bacterium]|nr:hypothetical protein [Pirellulales bacterium]
KCALSLLAAVASEQALFDKKIAMQAPHNSRDFLMFFGVAKNLLDLARGLSSNRRHSDFCCSRLRVRIADRCGCGQSFPHLPEAPSVGVTFGARNPFDGPMAT